MKDYSGDIKAEAFIDICKLDTKGFKRFLAAFLKEDVVYDLGISFG